MVWVDGTGIPRCLLDGGPYQPPNLGIVQSTLNPLYIHIYTLININLLDTKSTSEAMILKGGLGFRTQHGQVEEGQPFLSWTEGSVSAEPPLEPHQGVGHAVSLMRLRWANSLAQDMRRVGHREVHLSRTPWIPSIQGQIIWDELTSFGWNSISTYFGWKTVRNRPCSCSWLTVRNW